MVLVRLANGSQYKFNSSITVSKVVLFINPNLAKIALAGKVNGILVDMSFLIETDVDLTIVTNKDIDGLNIIRHSTAHLLAYAVKELFPDAQITIGPVIDNGFYYDFSYKRSFTQEDLIIIEKKMIELRKKNEPIIRKVLSYNQALTYFHSVGEAYKIKILQSISENQIISLYTEGNFTDLCRGPHVSSTGQLKVFKLIKLAGVYWGGDPKNEMLQRIYGTAWTKKEDQDNYLNMLQEIKKRDHRKLGYTLDLFHFQDEAPGLIFWHSKGWIIWQQIEQYMRKIYQDHGYQEVKSPQILDSLLWKKTGHWENYKDNMFITNSENRVYALKPMNCPGHIQIFNANLRSYRDLPLRYGEFGQCHRNEPSGALHGTIRVRNFTQDDGHIFCTEEQVQKEVIMFDTIVRKVYTHFGFTDISIKLALRPKKHIGTQDIWDKAENTLRKAIRFSCTRWEELQNEGAFYGPKIEYHLKDSIGRSWQCGTIQVDFFMPLHLGAKYITAHNNRKVPVMLHRAIIGSLERFIGILIENYSGAMPLWLAPTQVVIINISDAQVEYAKNILSTLKKQGFRVEANLRNEKITYKIRESSLQKPPYILVVGNRERDTNTVTVRLRGNVNLGAMLIDVFINRLNSEILNKI